MSWTLAIRASTNAYSIRFAGTITPGMTLGITLMTVNLLMLKMSLMTSMPNIRPNQGLIIGHYLSLAIGQLAAANSINSAIMVSYIGRIARTS